MGFWGGVDRVANGVAGVVGTIGGAAEGLEMAGGAAIPYVNAVLGAVGEGGKAIAAGIHGADAVGHMIGGDGKGAEAQLIDAGAALIPLVNLAGGVSDIAHAANPAIPNLGEGVIEGADWMADKAVDWKFGSSANEH